MNLSHRSKLVNMTCCPLFIGNRYVFDGHSSRTTSATATFVEFKGQHYVVTCRHVKEAAFYQPGSSARLQAGRTVISLDHFSSTGLKPSLRDVEGETYVDISICALPGHYIELLAREKPKAPINLDRYEEPRWDSVRLCLAAGFPDGEKSHDDQHVASPMVEVLAELASPVGQDFPTFTLQSELETPSPWGLSGMSGGPIFMLNSADGRPIPIGIIFEGHPSGTEVQRSADAFLGDHDVLIRGHLLTPQTFSGWLRDAGFQRQG